MTDKHLVTATIEPSVVREVTGAELLDLARQGLLHSHEHTPEAAAVLEGTVFKAPGKWPAAEKAPKKSAAVKAPEPVGASAPVDADKKGE